MFVCEKKEKISQFKGVCWHKQIEKWYVLMYLKKQKQKKYGGIFENELDAAKRVNQLCEELKISPQNPTISAIPNQQHQVTEKFFCFRWHCEKIRTVKIYLFNAFQK